MILDLFKKQANVDLKNEGSDEVTQRQMSDPSFNKELSPDLQNKEEQRGDLSQNLTLLWQHLTNEDTEQRNRVRTEEDAMHKLDQIDYRNYPTSEPELT